MICDLTTDNLAPIIFSIRVFNFLTIYIKTFKIFMHHYWNVCLRELQCCWREEMPNYFYFILLLWLFSILSGLSRRVWVSFELRRAAKPFFSFQFNLPLPLFFHFPLLCCLFKPLLFFLSFYLSFFLFVNLLLFLYLQFLLSFLFFNSFLFYLSCFILCPYRINTSRSWSPKIFIIINTKFPILVSLINSSFPNNFFLRNVIFITIVTLFFKLLETLAFQYP